MTLTGEQADEIYEMLRNAKLSEDCDDDEIQFFFQTEENQPF